MPRIRLVGQCPDIGIEEVPTTIARVHELKEFAIGKARRHRQWEDLVDPRRRRRSKKEMEEQFKRILDWAEFHVVRLLNEEYWARTTDNGN